MLRFLDILLRVAAPNSFIRVPRDLRSALKIQGIELGLRRYVCCPSCCQLYQEDGSAAVPSTCTAKHLGKTCGAPLFRQSKGDNGARKPCRRFFYQSPIRWLARFLQRPGMEDIADAPRTQGLNERLRDVWDGAFIKELIGDDGEWFFNQPGRYLFALGIDGFNPRGNRQKGKKRSVCGMYMALANLPIHLRYRLENICFVGIIPGPHEPSAVLGQYNRFLEPLEQEMQQLWSPGVQLSGTWKHPEGKLIKAAICFWINDLVGARPIGGFLSANAGLMCSVGYCHRHDTQKTTFTARTQKQHQELCINWLEAKTQEERNRIEKEHGTRGTALAYLPYFDGPRMTCPEGMHLVKNLIEHHLRVLFGFGIRLKDDLGEGLPSGQKFPSAATYKAAEEILNHGTGKELKSLKDKALEALAYARGLETGGLNKGQILKLLEDWVRQLSQWVINY